jgi:hypothetical protein
MGEIDLAGAAAIDAATLDALRRHSGQEEPYLVAAIFRDQVFRNAIVKAVATSWRSFRVHTVFIHRTRKGGI